VNWFVNQAHPSVVLRPAAGLLPITLFGSFVLVSMIPLHRCLSAAALADRLAGR
jgi:hypothetical protein